MNKKVKKTVAIIAIIILLANMLLFAFRIYGQWPFWIIVAVCAALAFFLPKVK